MYLFFTSIFEQTSTTPKDSISEEIAGSQDSKVLLHYGHFHGLIYVSLPFYTSLTSTPRVSLRMILHAGTLEEQSA